MYKIGDKVMHRQEGACFIKQIVDMRINNETKKYYLLVPLLDLKVCVYVSTDMKKQKSIRPIIELKEFKNIEKEAKNNPMEWLENPKQRFIEYSKHISSFNFKENYLMLKCLLIQNEEKRLSSRDGELLTMAQKLVYSELAILLNIDYEKIAADPQNYI